MRMTIAGADPGIVGGGGGGLVPCEARWRFGDMLSRKYLDLCSARRSEQLRGLSMRVYEISLTCLRVQT